MKASILLGYLHGGAWKILALVLKALFVFWVVPKLADGVFASYSALTTYSMLAALAASFGALDQLPLIIRSRTSMPHRLRALYHMALLTTFVAFVFYVVTGQLLVLALAIAAANVGYLVLAGLIRNVAPAHYELMINVPTVLFVVGCVALHVTTIEALLLAFLAANVVVPLAIAAYHGVLSWARRADLAVSRAVLFNLVRKGQIKTVSTMLMLADFRALVAAPAFLVGANSSDTLAVAIAIGEAFNQLAMVVVNRNYSLYAAGSGTQRQSARVGLALLAAFAIVAILLMVVPSPITLAKFDWPLCGWAVLLFGALTALLEVRAFLWTRERFESAILAVQVAIALLQMAIILAFPMTLWLPLSALGVVLIAVSVLSVMYRYATSERPRP